MSETDHVVGGTESRTVKQDFTPKEVWATVTVPSSYILEVWKSRNPTVTEPPKPEDLKTVQDNVVSKIEEIVEPLLFIQANRGQNTYKFVRVVVLDSLSQPAIEPPSIASNAVGWAGRYWSTLAMLGVAMFSLLVLRNVVKSAPSGGSPAAASAPALTLHADDAGPNKDSGNAEAEEERPRLRLKKSKSLKDDLVDIVREDPDAAADILRSWIAKAG
jgi:flagellar M-ring protein FliF